jgi:hypothetical protein
MVELRMLFSETLPNDIGLPIGIGGTGLAALIFYFYRQERDRVREIANQAMGSLTSCLSANTVALTKLTDVVTQLEGKMICPFSKSEIQALHDYYTSKLR